MQTKNLLRNRQYELDRHEHDIVKKAIVSMRRYTADEIVVRQNVELNTSMLLVSGLMTRHVDAADGIRQLVAVHVPGDFVDLHAYVLKRLDHDLAALTDIEVAMIPHSALLDIQLRYPNLTRLFWFSTMLDAAMHRQWVFRLSRLTAVQRVSHFLCEMNARLTAIGLSDGRRSIVDMTQTDIGQVCGLTNVHVNRVLRDLRQMELCILRASQLEILDAPRLAGLGLFDPSYLYLNDETLNKIS